MPWWRAYWILHAVNLYSGCADVIQEHWKIIRTVCWAPRLSVPFSFFSNKRKWKEGVQTSRVFWSRICCRVRVVCGYRIYFLTYLFISFFFHLQFLFFTSVKVRLSVWWRRVCGFQTAAANLHRSIFEKIILPPPRMLLGYISVIGIHMKLTCNICPYPLPCSTAVIIIIAQQLARWTGSASPFKRFWRHPHTHSVQADYNTIYDIIMR